MKLCSFTVACDYKVFTLYDPELIDGETGNEVTEEYVYQGFSWRRGNVDLYTLDEHNMDIEVFLNESVHLSAEAMRAIQVPFTVTGGQGVWFDGMYLSNVAGSLLAAESPMRANLRMPPGEYALVFEQGLMPDWEYHGRWAENDDENNGTSMWGRVWFNLEANAEAKVLVRNSEDLEFNPTYPLRLDAKPLFSQADHNRKE